MTDLWLVVVEAVVVETVVEASVVVVFLCEEAVRFECFSDRAALVSGGTEAVVVVVPAVVEVLAEVFAAAWLGLLAAQAPRLGASTAASTMAPVKRERKRDIRPVLRTLDLMLLVAPDGAWHGSAGVTGAPDNRARDFEWMGAAREEVRQTPERSIDAYLARTAVALVVDR